MLKVENIDIYGFDTAVRGMRNSFSNWDMSDSTFEVVDGVQNITIGDRDLDLMKRLVKAGVSHRTFMRFIQVSMDITAPLYWWKEMDRYAIGKTQNSTSTMHSIHKKPFELEDFSHEHLVAGLSTLEYVIDILNVARTVYLSSKSKEDWWQMIQLLPTSYNQRRTVLMSYEVVLKIIQERTGHKLTEWNTFIETLRGLPLIEDLLS